MTATHGQKAFYVVFAARSESSTGHAFVIWGIEDGERKLSSVEARGLYPESDAASCNVLVGTVPGRIMDEMANHSVQGITYALIVRMDEADFERSRRVARAWDCRHEFSLVSRDCVEFLHAVGASIHLHMPERGLLRLAPQAYIRALQDRAADGTLVRTGWINLGW